MILKLKMENGETLKEALIKAIEIAKKLDVEVSFNDTDSHYFVVNKYSLAEEKLEWYTKKVKVVYP